MAYHKYLNINFFLERISHFPLKSDNTNESILIEWIYDALEKINNTRNFIYKDLNFYLTDGKYKLPVDMFDIKYMCDGNGVELTESADRMTLSSDKDYLITNGYLYSNNKYEIYLTYTTIPLDKNGFPKIPDDPYFIEAIESYLKLKIGEIAYYKREIMEGQYRMLLQDWTFRLPGASTAGKMDILQNLTRFKKIHQVHKY